MEIFNKHPTYPTYPVQKRLETTTGALSSKMPSEPVEETARKRNSSNNNKKHLFIASTKSPVTRTKCISSYLQEIQARLFFSKSTASLQFPETSFPPVLERSFPPNHIPDRHRLCKTATIPRGEMQTKQSKVCNTKSTAERVSG